MSLLPQPLQRSREVGAELAEQGLDGQLGVMAAAVAPAEHPDAGLAQLAEAGRPVAPLVLGHLLPLETAHPCRPDAPSRVRT